MIATTLRLWMQRHVIPARLHKPAAASQYRFVTAVVVIVVAAASVAAFAIARSNGAASPPYRARSAGPVASGPGPMLTSKALAAATASRQQAAAWVATQVSHGVIVSCDSLMCAALQQRGFPVADLTALGAAAGDPLGSGIVISTTAVRSQLGTSLATVYAPDVIASFGTGSSLVQVRVVTPGGAAAYVSAERADMQARQLAGHQLAGNPNIQAPGAAKAELESGRVDSRLLITLAALAAGFRIQIQDFSDGGPGGGSTAPLRQLAVISSSATYLNELLAFLDAQRPPLLAIVSQHRQGATTTVQIHFTAPSPTGLLPASATQ